MRRARTASSEGTLVLEEISFHETLEQLYESTSWTILQEYGESYEMDQFLKGLQSPAHQALFVIQHAIKCIGSFDLALCHCRHFLKPEHQFIVKEKINSDNDDSGDNDVSPETQFQPCISYAVVPSENETPVGWRVLSTSTDNANHAYMCSSKDIVFKIVSLADPPRTCTSDSASSSEDQAESQQLLEELCRHLCYTLGTDLRNGTAAEAAFDLSLVGILPLPIHDNATDIYSMLAHISAAELGRKSARALRPASVLRVVEKLAASGLRNDNPYVVKAFQAAYNYLANAKNKRGTVSPETLEELRTNQLQLGSSRPLMWLWRRGHTFHKVSSEDMERSLSLETMMSMSILDGIFDDPTLPLVVDVGCGLGVSLLGLAAGQMPASDNAQPQPQLQVDWSRCNFLGGELSSHAVRWANAMASRWGISKRCHFLHVSTTTLLEYLLWEQTQRRSLRVELILLQFPTPYRLQTETSSEEANDTNQEVDYAGNSRLPLGPTDETFMANPQILRRMVELIRGVGYYEGNIKTADTTQGIERESCINHILLQSNCEDVALYIFDTLYSMDLEPVMSQSPRMSNYNGAGTTARTKTWLAQQEASSNGGIRRAVADHWYAEPIIPVSTETEAACQVQKTPIHRCLFRANS